LKNVFLLILSLSLIRLGAQAPSIGSAGLTIAKLGCDEIEISWTKGNGAGRLVVVQEGKQITSKPTDNTFYIPNEKFGFGDSLENHSAFVVYNGSGNSTKISNLRHNTRYFISIFEFNGAGAIFWYNTRDIAKIDTTTYFLKADFEIDQPYQCLEGNQLNFTNKTNYNGQDIIYYNWLLGDGNVSQAKDISYRYKNAGIYQVKLEAQAAGCTHSVEKNDTLVPKPEISFKLIPNLAGNDSVQCFPGNQFQFLPKVKFKNLGVSSNQYAWYFGDGNNSGEGKAIHEYKDTGTYEVFLIVQGTWNNKGYCADTFGAYYKVTSGPLNADSVVFSDTALCLKNNQFDFQHLAPRPGITNTWFFSSTDSVVGNLASWSYPKPGRYQVKLIAQENKYCRDSFLDSVEVFMQPNNFFVGLDSEYCQSNQSVFLSPNLGGGLFVGKNVNALDSSFMPQDTGVFHISYIYTLGNCKDTFVEKTTVFSRPKFYFPSDTSLCENDSLEISIKNMGDVFWGNGLQDTTRNIKNSGTYSITVFDKNGKCKTQDSFTLKKIAVPLFSLGQDTTLCSLNNFLLGVSENITENTYLWNTGSQKPTIIPSSAGNYTLTISNVCGSFSDDITIDVNRNLCNISYPSAFSPNNDGINDGFKINGNFQPIQFTIYNRWGERIHENASAFWDGTIMNRVGSSGMYYFILIALDREGKKIALKGSVYLIN